MNRRVLAAGLLLVVPLLGVLVAEPRPRSARGRLAAGRPARPAVLAARRWAAAQPVSLESLRGRPVVLNFWATWCVPCYEEHAVLVRAAARARATSVQFLGIVYEDEEATVQQLPARQGSAYPSLMDDDGKTAIAYGVFGVPETYFVDARGHASWPSTSGRSAPTRSRATRAQGARGRCSDARVGRSAGAGPGPGRRAASGAGQRPRPARARRRGRRCPRRPRRGRSSARRAGRALSGRRPRRAHARSVGGAAALPGVPGAVRRGLARRRWPST